MLYFNYDVLMISGSLRMLTNIFSSLIFPALFAYSLKTHPANPGLSLYISALFAFLAAIFLKRHLDTEGGNVLDNDELSAESIIFNHEYSPLDALDSNNTLLSTEDRLFVTSSSHHTTPRRGGGNSNKYSNDYSNH